MKTSQNGKPVFNTKPLKYVAFVLIFASQVVQLNSNFVFSSLLLFIAFLCLSVFIYVELAKMNWYRKSVLLFLLASTLAIIYGINAKENELFLVLVNFIKIVANQFVLMALFNFQRKNKSYISSNEKVSLIVIFLGGISFIYISVQYFELSTQVIVIARMVQFALIAVYGLFRKNLHWFISLYILMTFCGEFVAGLRVSGFKIDNSYFIQNMFLFYGIYFFCLGIRNTLTKHIA